MKRKIIISLIIIISTIVIKAQSFPPQVGFEGADAIHKDNIAFVDWANSITVNRGHKDIAHTENGLVNHGTESNAIGEANTAIISLGDGGEAIIAFNHPIINGVGVDFAIFENGFLENENSELAFLELAFVEVSTDGIEYVRFPTISESQTITQIGSFGFIDARYIHNFAGKYIQDYGTPFDLNDLSNLINGTTVDLNNINFIKIIDVVGTINTTYATYDDINNLVNDPYPTAFSSGGFDLNAVGVIHNTTTASIKEILIGEVNIYPNPVSNILNIKVSDMSDLSVNIFSLDGKLLLSTNKTTISLSQLNRGVYIINIKNELGVYIHKIIKN